MPSSLSWEDGRYVQLGGREVCEVGGVQSDREVREGFCELLGGPTVVRRSFPGGLADGSVVLASVAHHIEQGVEFFVPRTETLRETGDLVGLPACGRGYPRR